MEDGASGLLVSEGDARALGRALVEVARSPERWAEWGRAGRQRVEPEFNTVVQARRLEALYDEALASAA